MSHLSDSFPRFHLASPLFLSICRPIFYFGRKIILGPALQRRACQDAIQLPSDVIERQFPESLSPFLCATSITQYSDEDGGSIRTNVHSLSAALTGRPTCKIAYRPGATLLFSGPSIFVCFFSIPSSHITSSSN